MRTSDVDILCIPDHGPPQAGLWQDRWRDRLSTATNVVPASGLSATRDDWSAALADAVARAERPVVLVGHGLGVVAIAHAAPAFLPERVRGAFLVAPLCAEVMRGTAGIDAAFADIPSRPFAFPSVLVASRNDPLASFSASEDLGLDWGSAFVDAGDAGHLDTASGHGPWPEGLLRFAAFLGKL